MLTDKSALRTALLAARKGMTPATRAAANAQFSTALTKLLVTVRGKSVAGYVPIDTEPGASSASGYVSVDFPALLGEGALFPVLLPNNDLDWARGSLVPGPHGLLQPSGPRLGVDAIASVSMVIVPALAVDESGVRLGRGGGSYDRALARVPAGVPIVALVFDGELVSRLPAGPHDRPVTGVITPSDGFISLPRHSD